MNPESLRDLPGVLSFQRGLPAVDWRGLNQYLKRTYRGKDVELGRVYRALEQDFLRELARAFNARRAGGARYRLHGGRNFDFLSSARPATIAGLSAFAESTRKKILRALPNAAADDGHGAHVVLLLASDREYRAYNARYESHSGIGATRASATVGFYTNEGFGHFVIRHHDRKRTDRILTHELTHACLAHLPAPDWLHEGVACVMERALGSGQACTGALNVDASLPSRRARSRLLSFWREADHKDAFRTGRGFYEGGSRRTDHVREACFALAEGLAAHWFKRRRSDLVRLLREAHFRDGGRRALRTLFPESSDPVLDFLRAGE